MGVILALIGTVSLYLVAIGAYAAAHEIGRTSEREAKVWAAVAGVLYAVWLFAVLT